MNPRTCQLCGRPLSRLRVGGDGDFCSKEHRSQHRLRAGMDRLEEANKVTSLMRKREKPRQISASRLMCNSAKDPRGFYDSKSHILNVSVSILARPLPGPASPRVVSGADRYVAPRASQFSGTVSSRQADTSRIRINGRGTPPAIPPRGQKFQARVAPAPLAALRCEAPAPRAARRDFGMHRGGDIRVYLGKPWLTGGATQFRHVPVLKPQIRPQRIPTHALEGNALRVSIGIGFRVPALSSRDIVKRPAAPTGLVWPFAPLPIRSERHDSTAPYRDLAVAMTTRPARLPAIAGEMYHAQFVFPGSVAPRNRRLADGPPPAQRTSDISWKPSEPISRRMAVEAPLSGFARRNGAHLFSLVLSASTSSPLRQVALSAFVPSDPVGFPTVAFEGTVAAAIVGTPSAASGAVDVAPPQALPFAEPAPLVRIEEHFGGGWDDWVGGTKDWRVDVAGVRTGPLALFTPSQELIDYEMEFLARIDTRSLNWVVRAAGLDEYLLCTLTAMPGGELEFQRCAVVGNVAQPPVIAASRVPGKPRSAMTVGTRVAGDSFTVTVDGNPIETWNDDRFPMGGIGFMGAPDDRARLYWVRLASTELTAKEHQKK